MNQRQPLPPTPKRDRKKWSLPWLLTLAGLLLVAAAVFAKGWRLYRLYTAFNEHQLQIAALQEQDWRTIDPEVVVDLTRAMRQDTVALQTELAPFLPITPYLDWLPRVGPLMPAAENLLAIADHGTRAAEELAVGLAPALPLLQQDDRPVIEQLPPLLEIISAAQPQIERARSDLTALQEEYEVVAAQPGALEALPFRVRTLLPLVDTFLPLADDGLQLVEVLPQLLGQDGQARTYLLIAQNEEELRATGGFISGVGILQIENGRLGDLEFIDAYLVDDFLSKPYEIPPSPLEFFMGTQLLLFRDANYWPDFPTSAGKTIDLYTYGQGTPIDGLIAIDQEFLVGLTALLEPVEVPELDLTLTAANAREALRGAWETGDPDAESWFWSRKSFLGPVANALQQTLFSRIFNLDPLELADFVFESLAQKHLQLYFKDPTVTEVLAQQGWDNQIAGQSEEDTLYVVDTNMGFNKVNGVVRRQMWYEVDLHQDGTAAAEVSITYHHGGQPLETGCLHAVPRYGEGTTYDSLVNDCYWNFIRLLAPAGIRLSGGSSHPLAADELITGNVWPGEPRLFDEEESPPGLDTAGNFLIVPSGGSESVTFTYELPRVIRQTADGRQRYQLNLIKQPGTTSEAVTVVLRLPSGAVPVQVDPAPAAVEDGQLTFELDLDRDTTITVDFE